MVKTYIERINWEEGMEYIIAIPYTPSPLSIEYQVHIWQGRIVYANLV